MCMVHILYPIYLLKIGYIVEIVAHQALVYDYVNPLGGKGPFFPLSFTAQSPATIEGQ